MNRLVKTFDGTTASRNKCRFIKGEYYEINKQCFLIKDKWYRINSGYIIFNYTKKQWILKAESSLAYGVVSYDFYDKALVFGYFEHDMFKSVGLMLNKTLYPVMDYRILPSNLFVEYRAKGHFVPISDYNPNADSVPKIAFNNHNYGIALPYNFKRFDQEILNNISKGAYDKLNLSIDTFKNNVSRYALNVIGDLTFGFEFETNLGMIPWYKLLQDGLVPLRDGSIRGIEYATIPLGGIEGIKILEKATTDLKDYTIISNQESLHLHIGNLPKKDYKKFIARLFAICCVIEKEIYSMFPEFSAQTSKFKERKKDYNMPLNRSIASIDQDKCFNNLAMFLAESDKYGGLGTAHPNDTNEDHKWNVNTRYYWCNFIPALFGNTPTIEFRLHVPTFNMVKIINWLVICSSIIKYADRIKNTDITPEELKGITLKDILHKEIRNSKFKSYIFDYINKRKSFSFENDPTGSEEIKNDNVNFDIK